MKCAVEVGSGAMINIPHYIMFSSGVHKLIWRIRRQADNTMV
jgi:hypothetical protein